MMILEKFVPSLYVPSIYSIDLELLRRRGIKGILFDLDNTLARWDDLEAPHQLIDWVERLKASGFRMVIVSNNNRKRVADFTAPLKVPYIARAKKPLLSAYRKALLLLQLKREEVAVVGDQLLTDILGGNRMGLYTILVVPVAPTDGFVTRINRFVERKVLRWMKENGMIKWEVKE